jgi:hypothetical protein
MRNKILILSLTMSLLYIDIYSKRSGLAKQQEADFMIEVGKNRNNAPIAEGFAFKKGISEAQVGHIKQLAEEYNNEFYSPEKNPTKLKKLKEELHDALKNNESFILRTTGQLKNHINWYTNNPDIPLSE